MTYDISGKIGDLYPHDKPEWPMYSYDRPASILWNAIAGELHKAGWSDNEIETWLQSKAARWALDGELGRSIQKVGELFATRLLVTQPDDPAAER